MCNVQSAECVERMTGNMARLRRRIKVREGAEISFRLGTPLIGLVTGILLVFIAPRAPGAAQNYTRAVTNVASCRQSIIINIIRIIIWRRYVRCKGGRGWERLGEVGRGNLHLRPDPP